MTSGRQDKSSGAKPAGIIANLWCWVALLAVSLAALLLAPAWLILGRAWKGLSPARGIREGTRIYARWYLAAIRPFVKIELAGRAPKADDYPLIVTANHQSWLDLYLLAALPWSGNVCLLVRSWPFKRLFFFGPLMRMAAHIETEGRAPEEILNEGRQALAKGAVIACFPEGTRSPDGSLGRFRSGGFKLAAELDLPILPLIIHHSGRVMPKGSLRFQPGTIRLEQKPLIYPSVFKNEAIVHGALRRTVRRVFLDSLSTGGAAL